MESQQQQKFAVLQVILLDHGMISSYLLKVITFHRTEI